MTGERYVVKTGDEWSRVIGAGLVIVGVTIVVATLVEDFFTRRRRRSR
jgi:hypothetical protein